MHINPYYVPGLHMLTATLHLHLHLQHRAVAFGCNSVAAALLVLAIDAGDMRTYEEAPDFGSPRLPRAVAGHVVRAWK